MKIDKNYTFQDLNSFVNDCLCELNEDEKRFCLQLSGLTGTLNFVTNAAKKLSVVYDRLVNLKQTQDALDSTLYLIQKWQQQWEELLNNFERKNCSCQHSKIILDESRATVYQLADKIFTTLVHYYEALENMETKINNYKTNTTQQPVYALFEILNRNLQLLERLYLHIQKLQNWVNFNEKIIKNIRDSGNFY